MAGNGGASGGGGEGESGPAPSRTTPFLLTVWTAAVAIAVAALLGVTVGAFTAANDGTSSVAQHAAVASDSADLYFSLSDLDAEAARLVLLGNGADPATGSLSLAGDQISTLAAYNERTAQVDADLRKLAASAGGGDAAAIASLTSGVTEYHQVSDAAIALDQTAPSALPDTMGASAGQPAAAAIGYYGRATTLMQSQLLPEAKSLRDRKANELSDAASSAHLAGIIGASGSAVFGLLALVLAVRAHRRLRLWFRRSVNLGVLVVALISLALALGSVVALASTASDASNAGARFTDYLAVTRTRAASYDADGAVTRFLLMPDTTQAPLEGAQKVAADNLRSLGASGSVASKRWSTISGGSTSDIPTITGQINGLPAGSTAVGDLQKLSAALAKDTGTARGDEAFDFYYYDSALLSVSNDRLAAFDASMSAAHSDLSGWSWLPWALAVVALISLGLGVRPRFAEYR
jgi:hypothetical protein